MLIVATVFAALSLRAASPEAPTLRSAEPTPLARSVPASPDPNQHLAAPVLNLAADTTPCATNQQPRLVLVSVVAQRAWMCEATTQVYSTLVTTGAENVGDGTPLGTWHVQDKQTNRYLVGPGYSDFVRYWVPFNGDFGFHDAAWQTFPYGGPQYQANGSHGCVHLPLAAMTWLYQWATTDTTVTIRS
ncbi:L,D-transpeptidase [Jatrophihabitans sp. DSM 45814]